jgi:hypothetical protein
MILPVLAILLTSTAVVEASPICPDGTKCVVFEIVEGPPDQAVRREPRFGKKPETVSKRDKIPCFVGPPESTKSWREIDGKKCWYRGQRDAPKSQLYRADGGSKASRISRKVKKTPAPLYDEDAERQALESKAWPEIPSVVEKLPVFASLPDRALPDKLPPVEVAAASFTERFAVTDSAPSPLRSGSGADEVSQSLLFGQAGLSSTVSGSKKGDLGPVQEVKFQMDKINNSGNSGAITAVVAAVLIMTLVGVFGFNRISDTSF